MDDEDDGRPEVGRWVPAPIAYMVHGDELARRLGCDPAEGRRQAANMLLAWLDAGAIRSTAESCDFDLDQAVETARNWMAEVAWIEAVNAGTAGSAELAEALSGDRYLATRAAWMEKRRSSAAAAKARALDDGWLPERRQFQEETRAALPAEFWTFCVYHESWPANDEDGPSPLEWATGNFQWPGTLFGGTATGVEFALCDLPFAEAVRAFMEADAPAAPGAPAEQAGGPRQRRGGRRPHPAWPSFCAELVAYLLEHPGAVDEPYACSSIVKAVTDRLNSTQEERLVLDGKQAREAVSAVLKRLAGEAGA